jgi:hypothetical protein
MKRQAHAVNGTQPSEHATDIIEHERRIRKFKAQSAKFKAS